MVLKAVVVMAMLLLRLLLLAVQPLQGKAGSIYRAELERRSFLIQGLRF